ncbi:putative cyclophilin [Leptomonas pyrrhocoris]|uniref:Putative cyclophilin n=1 Tax=Leptomonas pyrrhocoris TaxID=157538 RepID=A0A0N0DTU9_LEPPY|nr:putative cyclophilin [Leptomonas pyrrhocoris]XP_015656451.1 putative cyclophilin [Leptomonas pyrrhocoris]XP_015656452.1 putative cyclophilin [Leptomonas pyrrhocoris]KPA78011.1 putative cyclophilin [Leptomonas pyrrhocoris]KPA78012.1 putative cyclophilin [Leptomonas pyrrhocoris]KPA78013.1 putative cyclophilin [Leptomonas pyrrhocoris]|eukprot:XP_015656450.1 putative cyclophilin [Leptomonas pyrrhocoris]
MHLSLSSTRHLGGTITAGSTASGSRYASHTARAPHTLCWMELAVFPGFPGVPSLSGTQVQGRQDLLASTKGAGAPHETSLMLQIELFDDECPHLCANFRRLCNGASATRQGTVYCYQGLAPSYRGTYFHKIIPSYCAQGGDITMRVVPGGSNSYSSAGRGWLPDEAKKRRHNEVGLVSMANNGPNSNGSQFFITTSASNERSFNGRHCCVGRVVQGLDQFLGLVAPCGDKDGRPSRYVVVVDCGGGEAPSSTFGASVLPLTDAGEGYADTTAATTATTEEEGVRDQTCVHDASSELVATAQDAPALETATETLEAVRTPSPLSPPAVPAAAAEAAVEAAATPSPPPAASPLPLKSSMKKSAAASSKHVTYKE